MEWHNPHAFWLLLLIPPILWLQRRWQKPAGVRYSSLAAITQVGSSWRVRLRGFPGLLRVLGLILLITALARPREGHQQSRVSTQGVVMYLVVDTSGSMTEPMEYEGKRLTRLDVVKDVLADFIEGKEGMSGRKNDMLGLVTYARYANTVCPLVIKHDILSGFLAQTQTVTPGSEEDATAIGEGLRLAAARLHEAEKDIAARNRRLQSKTEKADLSGQEAEKAEDKPDFEIQSKVIVLLTDGEDTARSNPLQAARLAQEWSVKVYTIGVGNATPQRGLFSMMMGPGLDEAMLKQIAETTGAFYGRADDAEALRQIIQKIDKEEKTEIESVEYSLYEERFGPWAWAAFAIVIVELFLRSTLLLRVP